MKYDENLMKRMAENLENYLDVVDNYVIIEGINKQEYDDAVETVKKLIKKLKKGKGEDVFDKERYLEAMQSGMLEEME